MTTPTTRTFLQSLFNAAVAAAHPSTFLPPLLPPPPKGRLILLAAGKAADSMAEVAEAFYIDRMKLPAGAPRRHRGSASRLWQAVADRDA